MKRKTLLYVLSKMLGPNIIRASYKTTRLHGGTVGEVRLISGETIIAGGEKTPYKAVMKTQKKWERYGDPDSWRREYDLFVSELNAVLTGSLRQLICYHAEMNSGETKLWMEYINGVSGSDLTVEMFERAAHCR